MPLPKPAAEWVPLDKLTPWAANPRRNDHAGKQVAASIDRFGFASPIIARPSGEVIAGHTRLKAAQHLGLDSVPVRYLDLTDTEARALAIADNRLGELAEWDDEGLAEVMRSIQADGGDLGDLGWDDEALAEALGDEPAPPADDEAPEVQAEVHSRVGEVYELGPHRLVCGDNTTADTSGCDALIGDPPFGISVVEKSGVMKGQGSKNQLGPSVSYRPVIGDNVECNPAPWLDVAPLVVLFGANYFASHLPAGQWSVWDKKRPEGTDFSDCELMWSSRSGVAVKKYSVMWNGMVREGETGPRHHPNQKPVMLMSRIIADMTSMGAVVLDPWGGSGSTLLGCAMTGRVARLIELDPAYCDVFRRRWTRYATENNIDPGPGALDG